MEGWYLLKLPASDPAGNPTGRPPKDATQRHVRDLARELAPRAIARLAELMESEDLKVAHAAAVAILERGYGQAVTREVDIDRLVQWEAERAMGAKKEA